MYDIYGGKGAAGSPVLIKEERERKSEDFRNGEMHLFMRQKCFMGLLTLITTCAFEYNLTGKEALCSGQAQLLPSM